MTVYVIKRKGDESGLIKIGFTNNLERRLYDLSTSTPEGFDVLYLFDAGRALESHLHLQFALHRVAGEWFVLTDEVKSILDVTTDAPEADRTNRSSPPVPDDEFAADIVMETRFYLNELVKREWCGMGDTVELARDRVMDACSLPRSYGFRLWSKSQEMNDVSGEAYRTLRIHYGLALHSEGRLTDYQRHFLVTTHWKQPAQAGMGVASAAEGKEG